MNKKPITKGAMSRLFLHMKKRFPSWNEQFNSDDHHRSELNRWYEQLKHFSVDDVKRGIDNWKSKEPPSIEQFVEYCKPEQKKRGAQRPKYGLWQGNERRPQAKQSTRSASLDKIRGDLS